MVEKTQMQNVDVKDAWEGFRGKEWKEEIDIREFIQDNFTPYDGDQSFLEGNGTRSMVNIRPEVSHW